MLWEERKRRFLDRMKRDLKTGYFDVEMLELVEEINRNDEMFTTSSCSGRVLLISGSRPWKKNSSTVLGKWHGGASYEEVMELIRSNEARSNLWLILQPPILHVACKNLETAIDFIRLSRNCGFRYSTILSKGDYGFLVEIMGSERLDMPIVLNGKPVVDEEGLKLVIDDMNSKLTNSKAKIKRLKEGLVGL